MRYLLLFIFFGSSLIHAQILEDFTDSNFTSNPVWVGDTSSWTIINGQLRSNSTITSDRFYLSTISSLATNTQWEFYVDLKFQTSSANYTDIYLTSDESDLKSITNSGYFVRIGNTSDEISLYKRIAGSNTKIIDGMDAEINSSNNSMKIKVTCNIDHVWILQSNIQGPGYSYKTEGTVVDSSITTSGFFGIVVQQSTPTFHLNHYYDNFYVGPLIIDNTSPDLVSSTVISSTQVDILFDEFVDISSAETTTNYTADNGLGNPMLAKRDATNFNLVHLTFSNSFPNGLINVITVSYVQDLSSNPIGITTSTFTFTVPETANFKDIIINEIFADPTPQIGLANAEFIEIYNRSNHLLDLSGWKLTDGSTTATLGSYILSPDQYLIICSKTDTAAYKAYSNVMGVSSFPTLNNAGDHIYLKNKMLTIIDSVIYTDAWYQNTTKKEGGWSLELTNPNVNPNCPLSNYWMASIDPSGGTPGSINSTVSDILDNEAPQLLSATIISKDNIQINFNKYLDLPITLNTHNFSIDNGIIEPIKVKVLSPDNKSIQLILGTPLVAGIIYTITVSSSISDCSGNHINEDTKIEVVIPEPAMPNDVVINEILFNPKANGIDFVEIYNRSNKIIDLNKMSISQYDTINNKLIGVEKITEDSHLIHPGEYLLLSENGQKVKDQYQTTNPKGFIDLKKLPSMSNNNGTICLSVSNNIVDLFKYNENMQFPLLNSTEGVALERIDFNRTTQDNMNWHSASETSGFATPAYKNSQSNTVEQTENAIEIIPEIFSPDEDGVNDVFNIHYHFDTPDMIGNIIIYDSKGRPVKQLVRNTLLGINGTFSWDGIDDNREKAKIGIYVVFVEVFDLTGKVKHYKKTCVLAGKI